MEKVELGTTINLDQVEDVLSRIIANNRENRANGILGTAVEFIGESGIGKTDKVIQIGNSEGLEVVKLNLSQIEELGDLVGFPVKECQVAKKEENGYNIKWISEAFLETVKDKGFIPTGKQRMGHAPPEWIADKKAGGILLIDDHTRGDVRFQQATMELVHRGEYHSWRLPDDWHVVLTANPEDGDYIVNATDKAQKTRYLSFNVGFDMECWAVWAEKNKVDGRCINFMLKNPEILTDNKNINARSATTFFNSINSVENFSEELDIIQMFGEGSVGTDFVELFITFIENKLDELPTPKEMMHDKEEDVLQILNDVVGTLDSGTYRADLAGILSTRFVNYTNIYSSENKVDKPILNRVSKLTTKVFPEDLSIYMLKSIHAANTRKYEKLLMMDETRKILSSQ